MGIFDRGAERSGGGIFSGATPSSSRDTTDVVRAEVERLEGIAGASDRLDAETGGPADLLKKAGTKALGALDQVLNVISRPFHTVTGIADEALKKNSTVGDVLKRAGSEFFSGLGGLEGEKKNFGQVLADSERIDIPEGGRISDFWATKGLFNDTGDGMWKFRRGGEADFTGRDVVGFGLDFPGDPLSYISGGTGRAAVKILQSPLVRKSLTKGTKALSSGALKRVAASGKVPLSKKGAIKFVEEQSQHLPTTRRDATIDALRKMGEPDDDAVERLVRELPELFDENDITNVLKDALPRVDRLQKWTPARVNHAVAQVNHAADQQAGNLALESIIRMADRGSDFIDPGGLKFAGKTILSGDKFHRIAERAKSTTVARRLGQTKLAAVFARGGRGLDAIFSESVGKVRAIPGARQARATARAHKNLVKGRIAEDIKELLPKSWRKLKVGGLAADEYMWRHLDNPSAFPADAMPPVMQEQIDPLRKFFLSMAHDGAALGGTSASKTRANYAPIILKNSRREIDSFIEAANKFRGKPHLPQEDVMQWGEVMAFDTIDELEQVAREMAEAGVHKFKPRLMTRLDEVMARRGEGHANMSMLDHLQDDVMRNLGVDADTVARDLTDRTFPALKQTISRGEDAIDPTKLGRALMAESPDLSKFTPDEKSLYVLGKLRKADTLEEFERILRREAKAIEGAAPGITEDLARTIGTNRSKYLNSFNEPMELVKRGPFKGVAYPTALAEVLEKEGHNLAKNEDLMFGIKVWDFMQSKMRLLLTGPFIPFHARNGGSNVAQNFLEIGAASLDLKKGFETSLIIAGRDGTTLTRAGRAYTNNEMRQMADLYGVLAPVGSIAEVTSGGIRRKTITSTIGNIARLGGVGQKIENHSRMMLFREKIIQGLDPSEAAFRVNRVLVDYAELSDTERSFMRRIFLFPKWMRENVEFQARKMITEPGRVAHLTKLSTREQHGPDPDMLPEYRRGNFKITLGSKTSDKSVFVTGLDLPFANAIDFMFGTQTENFIAQKVNSLTPYLTVATELAMKRDLFRGRDLDEAATIKTLGQLVGTFPKPLQNWLDFREFADTRTGEQKYTMNGTKLHLFMKASGLGRFIGTNDKFEQLVKSPSGPAWLDFITAIDVNEFDIEKRDLQLLRARQDKLEKILKSRGVITSFTKTFVPKGTPLREAIDADKPPKRGRAGRQGGIFNR